MGVALVLNKNIALPEIFNCLFGFSSHMQIKKRIIRQRKKMTRNLPVKLKSLGKTSERKAQEITHM